MYLDKNKIELLKKSRPIKLSNLIINLTNLWIIWMYNVNVSCDNNRSYEDRAICGKVCELLLLEQYKIIEVMDKFLKQW